MKPSLFKMGTNNMEHQINLDGLSVCIGMPASRAIHPLTVKSLLTTQSACNKMGIDCDFVIVADNAIVEWARDEVVDLFLKTDANRLFLIDSDIIWEAEDFIRMLALSQINKVMCATYTAKIDRPTFFVFTDEQVEIDEHGLMDIKGAGLGFTCVHREVIEKLADNAPRVYDEISDKELASIFKTGRTEEGKRMGEDMYFFKDIRDLGYDIKLDPTINLGHQGNKVYKGQISDALFVKKEVTILGLYSAKVLSTDLRGEVWTLGDFYLAYPWLAKVDRLYEMHQHKSTVNSSEEMRGRYYGDWKEKFKIAKKFIVDDEEWLKHVDGEKIDYKKLKKKYPLDFACTIDIMIAEAIEYGAEKINLVGVYMYGDGHEIYIKGLVKAMDYARSIGIEITSPYEKEWREYKGETITDEYLKLCRAS